MAHTYDLIEREREIGGLERERNRKVGRGWQELGKRGVKKKSNI